MSLIDVESLLADLSPDAPCGEDLSYDPAYGAMDRILTEGMSEGIIEGAVSDEEERGPNWRDLRTTCLELFGRTKDLRVALHLTLALMMEEGMTGLRDGLAVVQGLILRHWDHVHPQLDPDDDNDPLERTNILSSLSPPPGAYMDPMMFRKRVRSVPLCNSRAGRFSFQNVEAVQGGEAAAEAEGGPANDLALIDAAFTDTPAEDLTATAQAVADAIECVTGIEDALTERIGADRSLQFGGLRDETLGRIAACLDGYLAKRGLGVETSAEPVDDEVEPGGGGGSAAPVGAALSGDIRSPQDVLTAFGKICQYYENHEPSSPVPLLIHRAERLVSKSFLDIVRDLSPEVIQQIEQLGGVDSSEY